MFSWLYEPFDGSNRFFFNVKSKSISRPLWSQLHSSQFLSCQINPSFFQSFGVCQAQLTLPLPSGLAIHRAWHSKQHALHSVLWKGVVGHTLGLLFILLCTSVLLTWESLTAPWVPIIQDRGKSLSLVPFQELKATLPIGEGSIATRLDRQAAPNLPFRGGESQGRGEWSSSYEWKGGPTKKKGIESGITFEYWFS